MPRGGGVRPRTARWAGRARRRQTASAALSEARRQMARPRADIPLSCARLRLRRRLRRRHVPKAGAPYVRMRKATQRSCLATIGRACAWISSIACTWRAASIRARKPRLCACISTAATACTLRLRTWARLVSATPSSSPTASSSTAHERAYTSSCRRRLAERRHADSDSSSTPRARVSASSLRRRTAACSTVAMLSSSWCRVRASIRSFRRRSADRSRPLTSRDCACRWTPKHACSRSQSSM
eukprot:2823600-Prymnesium_polylepis.1